MASSNLQTRIPKTFGPGSSTTPAYAWTQTAGGDLQPTGAAVLKPGQAWTYDGSGNLKPSGIAVITDDPYWEYDGSGNLKPK